MPGPPGSRGLMRASPGAAFGAAGRVWPGSSANSGCPSAFEPEISTELAFS